MNPARGRMFGLSHTPGASAGALAQRFTRPIRLCARETLTAQGVLAGQRFTRRQRRQRAVAVWALLWALALVSALIPLVHFFLVPILLVAGPLAAWWRYRVTQVVATATGECPLCRQSMTLTLDSRTELPHWDVCPVCGGHLQLLEGVDADEGEDAR